MPYRIDIQHSSEAFDALVDLGALDVELLPQGRLAALMPDAVAPQRVADVLGITSLSTVPAVGRDAESVWVLRPRATRIGRLCIAPADAEPAADTVRLVDSPAFGTGWHPTTALCVEIIDQFAHSGPPASLLDMGTGSGVLALAALTLGVPRAFGIDIDATALRCAAANAQMNGLRARLHLARGGPEAVRGAWPLVIANVLAAPLIEMAPVLVRRVGHQGRLVLSGIPTALEQDVEHAYRRLGMKHLQSASRAGWTAIVLHASW